MFGGGGGQGQGQGHAGFGQQQQGFGQQQQQQSRGGKSLFNLRRDGIYPLTAKDFPSQESRFVWLVLFYNSQSTPEDVVQEYVKLGEKLKRSGVKTGAVDCSKYPEKCEEVVPGDGHALKAALITKGDKKILDETTLLNHRNTLNLKQIFEFVKEFTPSSVLNIRQSHQLETLLSSSKGNKGGCGTSGACLILWTANFEPSLLMKTLAVGYKNAVTVAEVRGGNTHLAKLLKVEEFPTLMMACEATGQWQSVDHLAYETFEGDIKDNKQINDFVQSFATDKTKCKSLRNKLRKKNKQNKKTAEDYMRDVLEAGEKGLKEFKTKKVGELKKLATNLGIDVEKVESLVEKKDLVNSIFEFWTEKMK
jgi:hypothetical protein